MKYVFEDDELRSLLMHAYRHGFSSGLLVEPADKVGARDSQVEKMPGFDYVAILSRQPAKGHKSF